MNITGRGCVLRWVITGYHRVGALARALRKSNWKSCPAGKPAREFASEDHGAFSLEKETIVLAGHGQQPRIIWDLDVNFKLRNDGI
jgi:hypothetical protein